MNKSLLFGMIFPFFNKPSCAKSLPKTLLQNDKLERCLQLEVNAAHERKNFG